MSETDLHASLPTRPAEPLRPPGLCLPTFRPIARHTPVGYPLAGEPLARRRCRMEQSRPIQRLFKGDMGQWPI